MDKLTSLQQIDRTKHIDGWAIRVYYWSRDPSILAWTAVLVIGFGLVVAWMVGKPFKYSGVASLRDELTKPSPDMAKVVKLLQRGGRFLFDDGETAAAIDQSTLDAADKVVAKAFLESVKNWPAEPSADLLYFAHYVKPLRFANELVGDLYRDTRNLEEATLYYEREVRFSNLTSARQKLVALEIHRKDFTALERLANDPIFKKEITPEEQVLLASAQHRFWDALLPLGRLELQHFKPIPTALAAVAGLIWFLIAWQAIQPPGVLSMRSLLPVLAVFAGMLSTAPTLLAVLWQEETWNLKMNGNLINDAFYFLAGVGPREEFMKLLFVAPFVPILLRRNSRLEMLMVSGCVGLGFAIQENVQYFAQFGPTIAFPRFLTANFFHLAATALIGLAFCDCVAAPKKNALRFAMILLAVAVAHGCYDAFLIIAQRGLSQTRIFSTLSFIILSLLFFRNLRELRNTATDHWCIAGTLILGISLLAAAILISASLMLGFLPAIAVLAMNCCGMTMVSFMFYKQLGEGMSYAASREAAAVRSL